MGDIRKFLIISFILLLSGCSTLGKKDKTFEAGYRVGVRENIQDFAQSFYGNDFPYFYWSSPVVQTVRMPARIENGVFIPEHNEPVIIDPAQWRNKPGYPINRPKNKEESKQKEGEEDYAFNQFNFNVRDITVLPESFTCVKSGAKDKDSR